MGRVLVFFSVFLPALYARAQANLQHPVQLARVISGYQKVDIRVDLSKLPTSERAALSKLVEARLAALVPDEVRGGRPYAVTFELGLA
jgi:hypothetical protein